MSDLLVCALIYISWANGVFAGWMYFSPNAPRNRQELWRFLTFRPYGQDTE